ncbi:hypothetical protein NE237_006036 [Protea cynaroides]|uniref:Uncharacterized protein n=1 Tax=Protea cynaroides TaxID=273540 RepID=A0A9Q0KLM0_9MAGN|nr:hypothetical protein NE237_006036 [Protea cynaroides]
MRLTETKLRETKADESSLSRGRQRLVCRQLTQESGVNTILLLGFKLFEFPNQKGKLSALKLVCKFSGLPRVVAETENSLEKVKRKLTSGSGRNLLAGATP